MKTRSKSRRPKVCPEVKKMANDEGRQFRSSMASILTAYATYGGLITDRHVEVMKKTPFYMLLIAFKEGKVNSQDCHRGEALTVDIVQRFNPATRKFRLGTQEVALSKSDLQLIFGIVDGDIPIKLYLGTKPGWSFYTRWFRTDPCLNPKVVKDKLHTVLFKENPTDLEVEDGVRMLCLLLLTTLFVPLRGFSLTWGWVEYLEDLDRMRHYDWSGIILSKLLASLVKHVDPFKVVGCTMVLPYWLCEHTMFYGAREFGEAVPRFVKWNLAGLKTVVTRSMLMALEPEEVVVGELVPTDVELAMVASLKEYGGASGSTSVVVKKKKRKIVDKVGPADGKHVGANKTRVLDDGAVMQDVESNSLRTLYSALVADHDDLRLKYKNIEEENLIMKEKLSGLVDAATINDAELATCKEEILILNGKLVYAMGETNILSGKYLERGRERDALIKRVKTLEKQLATQHEVNRAQSEEIDHLNDRWFVAAEPELNAIIHSVCADVDKSKDETDDKRISVNEEDVNVVTDASAVEVEKSKDEKTNNQSSMVKRLKGRSRQPVVIDDDFEFDSLFLKRTKTGNERTNFKDNSDFLVYLNRSYPDHCASLLPTKILTQLVETINQGQSGTMYYNADRLTVVDIKSIMDVFKGVYISNSVIDAYGQCLIRNMHPVKSPKRITIISADCWHRVVKQNNKNVVNEVMGAALANTGLILMPILSTGNTNEVGDEHWTLLVMDVDDQIWRFYNSKKPRTKKTVDKYFLDAKMLKEKLEIAMAEKSSDSLGYKVDEMDMHLRLVEEDAPSQGATCDCAIFVCYFMRQLVRNEKLNMKLGKELVRKFKAEVLGTIIMA